MCGRSTRRDPFGAGTALGWGVAPRAVGAGPGHLGCPSAAHYEGIDERIIDQYVDEEISIGDYVLTGGELPALVLADSVCRMIDGVLSDEECFQEESHFHSLLEYPQYTRPAVWRGIKVPDELMTGHHENVRKWRREQSILRTLLKRPDMLEAAELTKQDKEFLAKLLSEAKKLEIKGEDGGLP